MAKTATKTTAKQETKKTTAPPPKAEEPKRASVPAVKKDTSPATYDEDMQKAMGADSGRGVSTKAEDNIVPLIYVLQSLSPQVLKQKPEFIKDAEAGMFWYRGTKDVVDGDEGIPVVLCHMSKAWIEWRPNRGGFVAKHEAKPSDAVWTPDPQNPKRGAWVVPGGNIVQEVREHVVIDLNTGEGYVLPLTGSNHGTARQWMSNAKRKRIPGSSTRAPLWGFVWRIKTIARTNDDGDWFGVVVDQELNDKEEHQSTWMLDGGETYKMARELFDDFEAGRKVSDQVDEENSGDMADDEEDGDEEI